MISAASFFILPLDSVLRCGQSCAVIYTLTHKCKWTPHFAWECSHTLMTHRFVGTPGLFTSVYPHRDLSSSSTPPTPRCVQSWCACRRSLLHREPAGGHQPHGEGRGVECCHTALAGINTAYVLLLKCLYILFVSTLRLRGIILYSLVCLSGSRRRSYNQL